MAITNDINTPKIIDLATKAILKPNATIAANLPMDQPNMTISSTTIQTNASIIANVSTSQPNTRITAITNQTNTSIIANLLRNQPNATVITNVPTNQPNATITATTNQPNATIIINLSTNQANATVGINLLTKQPNTMMITSISMNQQNASMFTNQSTEQPSQIPYYETYWIASEVILTILTILVIYIFICLVRFGLITKFNPGREISGKKGRYLYLLCLLSVVFTIARFTADQAVAFLGWRTDSECYRSFAFSSVFYSMSLYGLYIFLWMRQSIFYSNPALSHVINPVVTALSYATLVIMASGGAVLTALYVIPQVTGWNYQASPEGCRDTAHTSGFDLIPTLVVCYTVIFQVSLLGLFLYPLLTKKTQKYRGSSKQSSAPSKKAEESVTGNIESNGISLYSSSNEHSQTNKLENKDCNPAKESQSIDAQGERVQSDFVQVNKNATSSKKVRNNQQTVRTPSVLYRKAPEKLPETKEVKKKKFNKNRISASSIGDLMRKHENEKPNSSSFKSETTRTRRRSKTQQGQRVIRFMRKAFLLALCCVFSDVIFTIVQLTLVVPELVYLVIFDVNLVVNLLCIIMSFREWPRMLFPLCVSPAKSRATLNGRAKNGVRNRVFKLSNSEKKPHSKQVTPQSKQFSSNLESRQSNGIERQQHH